MEAGGAYYTEQNQLDQIFLNQNKIHLKGGVRSPILIKGPGEPRSLGPVGLNFLCQMKKKGATKFTKMAFDAYLDHFGPICRI